MGEDEKFFDHSPKLCTHDAMVMIENFRSSGRTFIVYNESFPRCGKGVPFDFDGPRWNGCLVACSYEDDVDREWKGFR